jgi:cyclophilin family peptidyl-prolyl cis-trans isomerase
MKKYTSFVIVAVLIVLGVFLLKGNSKSEIPINGNVENIIPVVENTEQIPTEEEQIITNLDEKKVMQATLHTSEGDITIEFFDKQAPKTVENFVTLAKAKFYDGTKFHRVIKGFMIQGGDPLTKDDSQMARWGTGGPDYRFADEITATNRNDVGTISMANSGPNTNGSQFFINVRANNFLDTKHTVFGKVVAGMDVVTKIENTATGQNDRPLTPVVINSVTLK